MSSKKLFVVGMLVMVMLFVLAGCGGSSGESSGEGPADESANVATGPAEAATVVQAATAQIAEAVNTAAKVDDLLGSWVDVNDSTRFVNITSDGSSYTYEDNEGKLPATFENGVLKIAVSETDKADAYVDPATDHLMVVYQDNISEYSRKAQQ